MSKRSQVCLDISKGQETVVRLYHFPKIQGPNIQIVFKSGFLKVLDLHVDKSKSWKETKKTSLDCSGNLIRTDFFLLQKLDGILM
jgi:hypothetical protein